MRITLNPPPQAMLAVPLSAPERSLKRACRASAQQATETVLRSAPK
jgi:hypothetical protein